MPENVKQGRPKAGDFADTSTGEINDQGLAIIRRAAGIGIPMREIASLIGMSERTFYDRRKEFPDVQVMIDLGEAESSVRVANALMSRATNGDMAAIRWFEMTRKGRSEKIDQTVDQTSTQYVVEVPAQQSEEAWAAQNSPQDPTSDDSSPI